jgi:hypothetical protein
MRIDFIVLGKGILLKAERRFSKHSVKEFTSLHSNVSVPGVAKAL